jgi:hypothetical protein
MGLKCFAANAGKEIPDSHWPCSDQAKSYLNHLTLAGSWLEDDFSEDTLSYKSATQKIGHWVFITKKKSEATFVASVTRHSRTIVKWQTPKCTPQVSVGVIPRAKYLGSVFSDTELEQILSKNQRGFILSWSPHMPFSALALAAARKVAKAMNLRLTIVMDSGADPVAATKFIKEKDLSSFLDSEKLVRDDSEELIQRGLEIHFPTVIAYSHGQLSSHILPGYAEAELYEKYLKENAQ